MLRRSFFLANGLFEKAIKMSKKANKTEKEEKITKEGKKNTSLRLDKATLKALKIKAIEQETSIQKLIEGLIKDYLKKAK